MKLGLCGRLYLVAILLVLAVEGGMGLFLDRQLREMALERLETELTRQARSVAEMALASGLASTATADPMADRLGRVTGNRVTIIDAGGRVLGDSAVDGDRLEALANHGDRPEVRAALKDGLGVALRHSDTLGRDLLYVAVPYGTGPLPRVARVAVDAREIQAMIGEMRWLLLAAGAMGLVVVILITGFATRMLTRTLRQLIREAREKSSLTGLSSISSDSDLEGLASSYGELVDSLRLHMDGLARERDRLKAVLQCMDEGLFALDESGHIRMANQAALDLFNLEHQPLGQRLDEVTGIASLPALYQKAGEGDTVMEEYSLPDEGQRRLLFLIRSQRIEPGWVVVVHDVTDERRLDAMRREFIANASHELRTPISVIRANAETLLEKDSIRDPDSDRSILEALSRHTKRLQRLVDGLMDLSQLDAGHYHLKPGPVTVAEVMERVLESLQEVMTGAGIKLANRLDGRTQVMADPQALERVLANLLENAVKYQPNGGTITVSQQLTPQGVRIQVEDDGPGVAPEHRGRLFERFYRVDAGRSRQMGGTGLGLAIVSELVRFMQGQVGVDPGFEKGAIFWILLPEARRDESSQAQVGAA